MLFAVTIHVDEITKAGVCLAQNLLPSRKTVYE